MLDPESSRCSHGRHNSESYCCGLSIRDRLTCGVANLGPAAGTPSAMSKNTKIYPVESCQGYSFNDRCGYHGEQQQNEGDEEQD